MRRLRLNRLTNCLLLAAAWKEFFYRTHKRASIIWFLKSDKVKRVKKCQTISEARWKLKIYARKVHSHIPPAAFILLHNKNFFILILTRFCNNTTQIVKLFIIFNCTSAIFTPSHLWLPLNCTLGCLFIVFQVHDHDISFSLAAPFNHSSFREIKYNQFGDQTFILYCCRR